MDVCLVAKAPNRLLNKLLGEEDVGSVPDTKSATMKVTETTALSQTLR